MNWIKYNASRAIIDTMEMTNDEVSEYFKAMNICTVQGYVKKVSKGINHLFIKGVDGYELEWITVQRDKLQQLSKINRDNVLKRWSKNTENKSESHTNGKRIEYESNTNRNTERKKEREKRENIKKAFTAPTKSQLGIHVFSYVNTKYKIELKDNTLDDIVETIYDYYNSNGWKVGGKAAMKSWESAASRACREWDNVMELIKRDEVKKRPAYD